MRPLGAARPGTGHDIQEPTSPDDIFYLAGPAAASVTGTALAVDGGMRDSGCVRRAAREDRPITPGGSTVEVRRPIRGAVAEVP